MKKSNKTGCGKELCKYPDILRCGIDEDLSGELILCDECEGTSFDRFKELAKEKGFDIKKFNKELTKNQTKWKRRIMAKYWKDWKFWTVLIIAGSIVGYILIKTGGFHL